MLQEIEIPTLTLNTFLHMYNFSYLVPENLIFGADMCQSVSKNQQIIMAFNETYKA
jgi:hypothetical protein